MITLRGRGVLDPRMRGYDGLLWGSAVCHTLPAVIVRRSRPKDGVASARL
jgi:hypothetical protein